MNRLFSETLTTLRDAAGGLPGRPHVATVHRWRTRGIRGVRLECMRVGGRWFTSREAIKRFVTATTEAAVCESVAIHGGDTTSRGPEIDRHLDDVGL